MNASKTSPDNVSLAYMDAHHIHVNGSAFLRAERLITARRKADYEIGSRRWSPIAVSLVTLAVERS